jgi:hypothetical protein
MFSSLLKWLWAGLAISGSCFTGLNNEGQEKAVQEKMVEL